MPYVRLGGLEQFYEEFGRGEAVLLLHSHFSRGLLAFSGQLLALSGRYRCLCPDFRGHGRTRCESLAWDSRVIADDMAAFLDALGVGRAHLIGYSCGAYVGCYMAAKYPDQVKSLVTIGGAAYPRAGGAEDFLPERLEQSGKTAFIEDMKARHAEAHRGDWRTFLRMTVADWQSHPSLSEAEWRAIRCPALFINGARDSMGSCAELLEKVPGARCFEVPESGHRPHFVGERAEEVNARLLEFLSDVDGM